MTGKALVAIDIELIAALCNLKGYKMPLSGRKDAGLERFRIVFIKIQRLQLSGL